ncbi:MAG: nitrate reductase cytochrome c-type subunit [Coriobacteriia bacterium]|nr:nitrate reductase cytochrome c-type subunit [Coriobacteriia bacterium]
MKLKVKVLSLSLAAVMGVTALAACGGAPAKQDVNANVPEGAAPTMPVGHEGRYDDLGLNGCYGCHGANQDANPMLATATALPADHYLVDNPTSVKDFSSDHSQCLTCHVPAVG